MIEYGFCMGAGLLLTMLLYHLRLRPLGKTAVGQTAVTAVLFAVLSFAAAKVLYVLVMAPTQFSRYGAGAFLRMNMEEFSVFGGCLGGVAAILLDARLRQLPAMQVLDAFAPCGVLMLAVTRASEYFLGSRFIHHGLIGLGSDLMDGDWACFFPLAVQDEWETWFYAVFMLEAAVALAAMILSLTVYRKKYPFLRTVFLVMAVQIFCESLHTQSIRWGFVRVEQLLCAVGIFAITVCLCRKGQRNEKSSAIKGYVPCVLILLLIGVDVGVEFMLDKSAMFLSALHLEDVGGQLEMMLPYLCYGVMLLTIIGMLWINHLTVRRSQETTT